MTVSVSADESEYGVIVPLLVPSVMMYVWLLPIDPFDLSVEEVELFVSESGALVMEHLMFFRRRRGDDVVLDDDWNDEFAEWPSEDDWVFFLLAKSLSRLIASGRRFILVRFSVLVPAYVTDL